MINKIEEVKKYLQKAYNLLPRDFALREVRFYINQAFQKINKHNDRQIKKEEQKLDFKNPYELEKTLAIIDNMIKEENKKIEDLKKGPPEEDETVWNG